MADLNYGALWPGWETVRLIGRGSFGAVYEIRRDMFGHRERAALKVITIPQSESEIEDLRSDGYDENSIAKRYEGYLQDVVREYSTMAEMKGCANIVYCDDVQYRQHENGIGWDILIKMELLTALPKLLGDTVPDRQIIKIGKDICSALAFCEKRNVLHRDIKPQNIFAAQDGTYKLGDFGIAKTAERTTSGTKTGTYKYMAPEVYNNRPYGGKADLYSLGLVLYWLLNERRTPFLPLPPAVPTASEEERARTRRFQGEPLPSPAHGSDDLKRIVLKACAFDPKDRYQSAEEMLRGLESLDSGFQNHAEDTQKETAEESEEESAISVAQVSAEQKDEATVGVFRGDATQDRDEGRTVRTMEEETTVGVFKQEKHPVPEQSAAPAQPEKKTGRWAVLLGGIAAALVLLAVLLPKLQRQLLGETAAHMQTAVTPIPAPVATPWVEGDWDWSLEDGVLTIRGNGNMADFTQSACPWKNDRIAIREVVVEEGITGIGVGAFDSCSNLVTVTLPESVHDIGGSAFCGCSKLSQLMLPGKLVSIGDHAFFRCGSLTAITLPETVISIGENAFAFCNGLREITLPNSVLSIGNGVFIDCGGLQTITVSEGNPNYSSIDGVLFSKDRKTVICYPEGKDIGEYYAPNGVTSIGEYAFHNCRVIVHLPEGVTSIGKRAFYDCRVSEIWLPDSITSIGESAFNDGFVCLKIVYYDGTRAQWEQIQIENGNERLLDVVSTK